MHERFSLLQIVRCVCRECVGVNDQPLCLVIYLVTPASVMVNADDESRCVVKHTYLCRPVVDRKKVRKAFLEVATKTRIES